MTTASLRTEPSRAWERTNGVWLARRDDFSRLGLIRSLVNAVPGNVALVDRKGTIFAINEAWRSFATESGFGKDGWGLGENYLEVCKKASRDGSLEAEAVEHGLCRVLEGKRREWHLVYRSPTPEGLRWYRIQATALESEDGCEGAMLVHTDVSESVVAEAAQKAQARGSEKAVPPTDLFATLDREWRFTSLSGTARFCAPDSRQEMLGECLFDCIPQDADAQLRDHLTRVVQAGEPQSWEVFDERDGRFLDHQVYPTPEGATLIVRDVTEQRVAEQRLRQSEERYRSLVAATSQVVLVADARGDSVAEVEGWQLFTGESAEELREKGWARAIHEEDRSRLVRVATEAAAKHRPYEIELRLRRFDGEYRLFAVRGVPVYDEHGSLVEWVCAGADVSEQRAAERLLEISEERYRSLATAKGQIVWVLDAHGRSTGELSSWQEYTGQSGEQRTGLGHIDAIHPQDRERVIANFEAAFKNKTGFSHEYRLRRADGIYRTFHCDGVPVFERQGEIREWVGTLTDVTDLLEAQSKLALSEERYRSLVSASAQIVWTLDAQGRSKGELTSWNDFTGQSKEEVRGHGFLQMVHPDDLEAYRKLAAKAAQEPRPYSAEARVKRADGEYRHMLMRCVPVFNEDGTLREWVGTFTDITERKEDERKRFELVSDLQARVRELKVLEESGRLLQLDERPANTVLQEIVELLPQAFEHPDRVAARIQIADMTAASQEYRDTPWKLEQVLDLRAARIGQIDVVYLEQPDAAHGRDSGESAEVFSEEQGRLLASLGEMLVSHFERRAAEESLYLTQFALDHSAAAAFLLVEDGRFAYGNGAACDLVGLSFQELVAADVFRFRPQVGPHDWQKFWRLLERVQRTSFATEVLHGDGHAVPVEVYFDLVEFAGVQYASGVALDLTERRRAEQERGEALATVSRLGQIVQDAEDAIIGADLEGRISSWNRGAERMFGHRAAEIVGQSMDVLVPEDRLGEAEQNWSAILHGMRVSQMETVRLHADGGRVDVSLSVSPIQDQNGRVIGMSAIGRDISRHKELEEQLRQSQKMEAIGHLAGGIAHDFNNLLTVINGYGDLLADVVRKDPPASNMVREIRRAGAKATALTSKLLAFGRRQVLKPVALDLNGLVSDLERMLDRLLGETIALETVLDPGLEMVEADPSQIEQVIMNLVVNARDAVDDGGVIRISTSNVTTRHPDISQGGEWVEDAYVVLRVSDDGAGMDAETRSHLFEPFFTTKPTGKGTGLGLATVYGIVEQSGGFIDVESEQGRGSTFSIYLPRHEGDGEAGAERSSSEPKLRRGSGKILLVEDDDNVRDLLAMVLETAGYDVLTAPDGEGALELSREISDQTIDLLITDVVMPRLGGSQLSGMLTSERPGLKVLFLSGYSDEAIERHGVLGSGGAFLQKPCSSSDLTRTVREMLQGEDTP